jgi:hypothetical protein
VRPIERMVGGRDDAQAQAVHGYCAAVRSAITDDGRPPLAASGLRLELPASTGLIRPLHRLRRLVRRSLERTRDLRPDIRRAYGWVHAAARILENEAGPEAEAVARRFDGLLGAMARHRAKAGAIDHWRKVSASYRPGLFHAYRVPGLPRTNNALEHLFGSHRHHDRRATGRKTA